MCLIHFLKLIHVKESFHKLKGANSNFGFHFGTSIHVMYTDGHKSIQISGPKRFQKGYISQFIDFCVWLSNDLWKLWKNKSWNRLPSFYFCSISCWKNNFQDFQPRPALQQKATQLMQRLGAIKKQTKQLPGPRNQLLGHRSRPFFAHLRPAWLKGRMKKSQPQTVTQPSPGSFFCLVSEKWGLMKTSWVHSTVAVRDKLNVRDPGKRTNVPWKSMVGSDVFPIETVPF